MVPAILAEEDHHHAVPARLPRRRGCLAEGPASVAEARLPSVVEGEGGLGQRREQLDGHVHGIIVDGVHLQRDGALGLWWHVARRGESEIRGARQTQQSNDQGTHHEARQTSRNQGIL